jgi:hypothetical protein
MDRIKLIENFLTDRELETALSIINNNCWKFGHISNGIELINTPFWSMDLMDNEFFSVYIKELIEKTFSRKYILHRVYANGQTYGQNGSYHKDSEDPNTYTVCLYLTDIHKKSIDTAGGYLYIKLENEKYNVCYEPVFNRIILFPSNYYHKGCAFNRFVLDMRICISWKLEEIVYL